MGLTYRILTADEWPKVEAFMERYKQQAPSPQQSVAAVAEDDDGVIQGVLFMQIQWHCEPLILNETRVRYDRLYAVMREHFTGLPTQFYCYTDNELVGKMAASMGLAPIGQAWKGEF